MFVLGSSVFCSFIWFSSCFERYHWLVIVFWFICICMFFEGSGRVQYFVWYIDRDLCMFFSVVILTESLACLEYDWKFINARVHSMDSMVIAIISSSRVKAFLVIDNLFIFITPPPSLLSF